MAKLKGPFYICLMKSSGYISVLASRDDGVIIAKTHSHEWKSYFEDTYNNAHYRSYEGSMSACLNNITMSPSIIQVKDIADIKERILDEPTAKLMSFSNISGGFVGVVSDIKLEALWDKGNKPHLIN